MALFVALIFQILFLFFAMVINVGLLVHHKINLQNSVDLAAYYGAMRQAENMNAIGHVNYQIRQSWKLLSWRYRMLGSAGEWEHHPFNKERKMIDSSRGGDADELSSNATMKDMQEAPAFCITYIPFKPMPPGENTCRNMATKSGIKLFSVPPVIAAHQSFSKTISNVTKKMQDNALERCRYFGSYNYVMLGKFIVAFNIDQKERMDFIAALSRATSYASDDFWDIDGQKASDGIKNTLMNNLTSANRSSLGEEGLKIFNSLGADGCNASGAAEGQPAKWLNPIRIYPGFSYIDTNCEREGERGASIYVQGKELTGARSQFPEHFDDILPEMRQDIQTLSQYIGYRGNLNDNYNFSTGVEKNPWCMAYVGVAAETMPKIPFSPFGGVKLKARAFYKPFGGRIGPWYQERWSPGSDRSNGGEKVDPLLPPRVTDLSALPSVNDAANKGTRASNFSRFVGDQYGLKTLRMLAHYGKAIYQLDPKWKTKNYESETETEDMYKGDDAPNFAHWDHLPFNISDDSGDVLAWDSKRNAPSLMRRLEIAGIAPDNFDMAYYSIDPDFYHNYYLRIRDGYLKGPGKDFDDKSFRPDIGYHKGYKSGSTNLEKFTIRDQIATLKESDLNLPIEDGFTFLVTKWQNLLTSWAPKDLMDYSLNKDTFGECQAEPLGSKDNDPKPPTPGNCVVGGTTGYSVKMVSSNYLRSQELVMGGEAAGSGPLKNPPPSDDEF